MGIGPLAEAEHSDRTFKNLQCQGEELCAVEFYECRLIDCSFAESVFQQCRFIGCTFEGCDLSLAHVPGCTFRDTTFVKSKLIGIDWTKAVWGRKQGILNSAHFIESTLNYSTFIGLELPQMRMVRCVARDVDFAEADLTAADFTRTDLTDSRFWQTNLTQADFTGATGYSITATLNTLKKTRFSLPEAISLLYSLDIVLSGDDNLRLYLGR